MAETEVERKKKDDLIRETIMAKLIETGEKDKLKGIEEMLLFLSFSLYFLSKYAICALSILFIPFEPHNFHDFTLFPDLLHERLIACGWRDELKEYCKQVIRRKGLEKVTVEELVAEITPKGRSSVPEDIKADLLQRIRKFLQSTS